MATYLAALLCTLLLPVALSLPACCKWGDSCWPSQDKFNALQQQLSGQLRYVNSSNPLHAYSYHKATSIADQLYQKTPSVAVIPATEADVQHTVAFLAQQAAIQKKPLCISVRGGGGSLIGRSSSDGGMHISLEKLDSIIFHVLNNRTVVTVGGGANWGQVQSAANLHRQFLPTAECPKLGVGGFTQHGGGTVMSRSLGLASDNLVSFHIVLPNATALNISRPDALSDKACAANHSFATAADIWWAVRGGGGGSWGVITSFTFQTHPQPAHVVGMTCVLPLATESIQAYFDLLPTVPNEWGFTAILANIGLPLNKYLGKVMIEGIHFGTWASAYPSVSRFLASHPKACSLSNWSSLGWWENLAEGAAGCELVQTGRVYSTSLLSQSHHLRSSSGLSGLLHEFLSSAGHGATRVCTPSQLGGQIQALKGRSGGAVSPYFRDALLDTACVTRWSDAHDDSVHIAQTSNFSTVYHSGQYGHGTYIGEPLAELDEENGQDWQAAYWDKETATTLKRIKTVIDPLDILHCKQCVSSLQSETLSV